MDIVIQKFIDYLEKSSEDIKNEMLERKLKNRTLAFSEQDDYDLKRIAERKNLLRILRVPESDWNYHGEVFIEFKYLSEMFEGSRFKYRELFFILKRLLQKNLATNIFRVEAHGFDIQKIDEHDFEYMTREEFLEFVRSDEQGRIKDKDESEWTEHERKCMEDFHTFSDKYPLDLSYVQDTHRLIKEHYFDVEDSFTKEDVKIFIDCLKSFGLDDSLAEIFTNLLLREIEKRQEKERREQTVIAHKEVPVKEEKPVLSTKEYNLIERELRQYFDLRTMEAVGPLTLDLQIYCVGLLLKLGFSETKIVEILKIINKNGYSYDNPISMFVALYEKLEYYKDVDGIKEAIEIMLGAMSEIMIVDNAEYEEWRTFIGEELDGALKLIPKTYAYEIEKAKKGSK